VKKSILLIALAVFVGIASLHTVGCAAVTEQRAVISGEVVAEGLVQTGALVQQGDILVKVKSLAGGSIAAARATTAGKVSQVLVEPGQLIVAEQIVAKISE